MLAQAPPPRADGEERTPAGATVGHIVTTSAELRVRQVLRDAGLGRVGELTRAPSRVNEVWMAGPYVVRVCGEPETERLTNEVTVARALGDAFPYPPIVAHGRLRYAEWMVTERVPGDPLSHTWTAMPTAEREEAMRQLARALRLLHATPPPHEPAFTGVETTACPHQLPPRRLLDLLQRWHSVPGVTAGLIAEVTAMVERLSPAVTPWPTSTLVHGDLHLDNVLWDGYRITAVLDLEWSRPGPADLDLDILLRYCSDPAPNVALGGSADADQSAFQDVAERLAGAYPELFSAPGLEERLLLYALAYDVPDLLRSPAVDPARMSDRHPLRRVRRLLDGQTPWISLAAGVRERRG